MITLRIFVMGFIALVPYTENGFENHKIIVPQQNGHTPVIVFDEANIHENDSCEIEITGLFEDGPKGGESEKAEKIPACVLDGDDIQLARDSISRNTPLSTGECTPTETWAKNEWHNWSGAVPNDPKCELYDASWIPDFRELVGNEDAAIKRALFEPTESTPVDGILDLKSFASKLSTFSAAHYIDKTNQPQISSITFKKLKRPHVPVLRGVKQAVADIAVFEIKIESRDDEKPDLVVDLVPLRSEDEEEGKEEDTRVIELKEHLGRIDILIGNLTKSSCEPGSRPNCDEGVAHFEHYYGLLAKKEIDARNGHCGMKHRRSSGLETPYAELPNVLKSVGQQCRLYESGLDRPMCAVATFAAPPSP